jgi:hypothetical protein
MAAMKSDYGKARKIVTIDYTTSLIAIPVM